VNGALARVDFESAQLVGDLESCGVIAPERGADGEDGDAPGVFEVAANGGSQRFHMSAPKQPNEIRRTGLM
jgi:hypothetical protein